MTGTGLKKCRPPNLSLRSVELAISVTEREEVLVVKMVELCVCGGGGGGAFKGECLCDQTLHAFPCEVGIVHMYTVHAHLA